MVIFLNDLETIGYCYSLINQFFAELLKQMKISENGNRIGNLGYLGICIILCTVALFFRSVSWKRGAGEPGSK